MSRGKELFFRILSSFILIPVLIFIIFSNNPFYLILLLLLVGCWGLYEFYQLILKTGIQPFHLIGYLGLTLLLLSTWRFGTLSVFHFVYLWLILAVCLLWYIFIKRKSSASVFADMGITMLGVLYIGLPFMLISILHEKSNGSWYIIWLLLVTWFCDSGAYFIGSAIGKHKLIPSISPGKTVEGFLGGIITSLLVAFITWYFIGYKYHYIPFSLIQNFLLALIVSLVSVVGDLAESIMKRQANVKDSGNLFIGHGGLLDVIDSLLFTAPVFYYLVILLL